jgi:hypothetical protein
MRRLRCWLFGHDRMTTRPAHGVCLRCGHRARRIDLARAPARAEGTGATDHGPLAGVHAQVHSAHHGR